MVDTCGFSIKAFGGKHIITICEFYELYGDIMCRGFFLGGGGGLFYGWPMMHDLSLVLQGHL